MGQLLPIATETLQNFKHIEQYQRVAIAYRKVSELSCCVHARRCTNTLNGSVDVHINARTPRRDPLIEIAGRRTGSSQNSSRNILTTHLDAMPMPVYSSAQIRSLVKICLINLLDMQNVFIAASNVVFGHQLCQLRAVD